MGCNVPSGEEISPISAIRSNAIFAHPVDLRYFRLRSSCAKSRAICMRIKLARVVTFSRKGQKRAARVQSAVDPYKLKTCKYYGAFWLHFASWPKGCFLEDGRIERHTTFLIAEALVILQVPRPTRSSTLRRAQMGYVPQNKSPCRCA